MPELPEVETVRRGLEEIFAGKVRIHEVKLMRKDVRFTIPRELPQRLRGQAVTGVRRRAKYLLIETAEVILLSHLGMTGSWRIFAEGEDAKHDHCYIFLSDGRKLAFRDPRRFGILDLVEIGGEARHVRLKGLGVEPLSESFNAAFLFARSRGKRVSAKVLLMDQRVVVGVGNIYASEVLFRAHVRPQRQASRLSLKDCEALVAAVRAILLDAIAAGGSTISDYRSASGGEGSFQNRHLVYARTGQACLVCGTKIKTKVVGGRSTFWCPVCQPR